MSQNYLVLVNSERYSLFKLLIELSHLVQIKTFYLKGNYRLKAAAITSTTCSAIK